MFFILIAGLNGFATGQSETAEKLWQWKEMGHDLWSSKFSLKKKKKIIRRNYRMWESKNKTDKFITIQLNKAVLIDCIWFDSKQRKHESHYGIHQIFKAFSVFPQSS